MSNIILTVLGSGVMVPTKERNPAGFLLEIDHKNILLDCGHGIIRRLTDYGYHIQDIDRVFISHFHTDHFGDAFNLVHSRWVDDAYHGKDHQGLEIWGPKDIQARFNKWRQIYWVEPDESYPIHFFEGPQDIDYEGIDITLFPVTHVKWFSSVGIIIRYQNKKIVYTGDIGSQHDLDQLIHVCQNADLLITEMSYIEPTPHHFTIGQILQLKSEADIKKILAVHIRPQHEQTVIGTCRQNPSIILGIDGYKIEI